MIIRKFFGGKKAKKEHEMQLHQHEISPHADQPMAIEFEPKNVYFVYTPNAHWEVSENMKTIERRMEAVCSRYEKLVAAHQNLQCGGVLPIDSESDGRFCYDVLRDVKPTRRLALASTISESTPLKDISVDDVDVKPFSNGAPLAALSDGPTTAAEELARSWRVARTLAAYCHKDNANAAALERIMASVAKGRMPNEIDLHLTNFEQLDSDTENYDEDECFERENEKHLQLDAFLTDLKTVCEDTMVKSEHIHQNVITCIGAGLLKSSPPASSVESAATPQKSMLSVAGDSQFAESGDSGGGQRRRQATSP